MAKALFKYTVILLQLIPAVAFAILPKHPSKKTLPNAHQLAQRAIISANNELDSMIYYAELANKTAYEQNDGNGILDAWLAKARYYFYQKDNDKTTAYAELVKKYAIQLKNDSALAEAYFLCGEVYCLKPDYHKSLISFFKALNITDKINSKTLAAKILSNMGDVYYYLNQFDYALQYYNQAITIAKGTADEILTVSFCQSGVADIYRQQKNYLKSVDLYKQSLKLSYQTGQVDIAAFNLWGLGANYVALNDYAQAKYCLRESIALSQKIIGFYRMASCYTVFGKMYAQQNNYTEAQHYYYKSDSIAQKQNYMDIIAENSNARSNLYYAQNNFSQAIVQATAAYNIALKEKNSQLQKDALVMLQLACEKTGDIKNKNKYRISYQKLADSIQTTANNEQTIQLQLKFELEKENNDLKLLGNDEDIAAVSPLYYEKLLRNISIIGFACFFACILFVYTYHYYKSGNKL